MTEPAPTPETPPPVPVLVGDTAAELLRTAHWPAWFPSVSLAALVGLFLAGGAVSLMILLSVLIGIAGKTERDVNFFVVEGLSLTFGVLSFTGFYFLLTARRTQGRMYDAAKGMTSLTPETASRLLYAAQIPAWFRRRVSPFGFALYGLGGVCLLIGTLGAIIEFTGGNTPRGMGIGTIIVLFVLAVLSPLGGASLLAAATALRRVESLAKGKA